MIVTRFPRLLFLMRTHLNLIAEGFLLIVVIVISIFGIQCQIYIVGHPT